MINEGHHESIKKAGNNVNKLFKDLEKYGLVWDGNEFQYNSPYADDNNNTKKSNIINLTIERNSQAWNVLNKYLDLNNKVKTAAVRFGGRYGTYKGSLTYDLALRTRDNMFIVREYAEDSEKNWPDNQKDYRVPAEFNKEQIAKEIINKYILLRRNAKISLTEDIIEEEIDPRIKTRIENETGYKVYLIRNNQGIEVYLKSKYCPKGQRYDITWFQNTGNVEKQYNLRDKTIDSAKIKQVCKNEFSIYKEDVNYFDY